MHLRSCDSSQTHAFFSQTFPPSPSIDRRLQPCQRATPYPSPAMNCFASTPTQLCYRPLACRPQWVAGGQKCRRQPLPPSPSFTMAGQWSLGSGHLGLLRISVIGGFPLRTCQLFWSVSDVFAIDGSLGVINVDVVAGL